MDLFETFLRQIEPLGKKTGPLIFQFDHVDIESIPSQTHFQNRLRAFFDNCPDEYTYAIEIRNSNYLNEQYFDFLNEVNCLHVFVQGYYMPPVYEVFKKHEKQIPKLTIIKLLGSTQTYIEQQTTYMNGK